MLNEAPHTHTQINNSASKASLVTSYHRERHQICPTILPVERDLHFPLLRAQKGLRYLRNGVPLGQLSVQEVARARLLHDVRPREARHLAEAVVAEDDGAVLHPGIGYDKLFICGGGKNRRSVTMMKAN